MLAWSQPDCRRRVSHKTTIHGDLRAFRIAGNSHRCILDFMQDCANRISSRVQVTTDAHRAYLNAVEGAFGMDADYAQLQKIYGAPTDADQRRYSAHCIGTDLKVVSGNPDPDHVSTSFARLVIGRDCKIGINLSER
jgi:hypothetical protein